MTPNTASATRERPKVNLGRHESQCTICSHPNRLEIEEAFIGWVFSHQIVKDYHVSRDCIYRHAHALDLFSQRQKNIKMVYEKIIEKADLTLMSGSNILSVLKAYEKICSAEQGAEPVQGADPKKLLGRMSQEERDPFAQEGSLPERFPAVTDATSGGGQEKEKESQVTDDNNIQ